MNPSTFKTTSIIIPSYQYHDLINTEVRELMNFLNSRKVSFEIILVDDGSPDPQIPEAYCKELNIKFIRNKKNLGKGASTAKGMKAAKGDFLLYTDADVPFLFEDVLTLINTLAKGADMVIGDRNHPDSDYHEHRNLFRAAGSRVYTTIIRTFLSRQYSDTQCGLKGFQAMVGKDLFNQIKTKSFAFDVELIKCALKRNYTIKKIPVVMRKMNTRSTVSLRKHALPMLVDTLKILLWN